VTDDEMLERERPRLFALAYRMLGSVAEAEDIVQDAFAKLADLDPATVRSGPALLTTIVTRLSINALHSARRRREKYVGAWLPEPIVTDAEIDPASVSMAFMVLLETLTPNERAAFLLHKVFDYTHDEIAAALGVEVATSRQLVHRSKQHLEQGKPRFRSAPEVQARLFAAFGEACRTGDVERLEALLTDDVVCRADHGGKASAARKTMHGPEAVARLVVGLAAKFEPHGVRVDVAEVNGGLAALAIFGTALISVITIETDGEKICEVNMIRNPDKLAALAATRGLVTYREPRYA
jgi:RNA polymerase sigma-70 factor (ECF subfamily)